MSEPAKTTRTGKQRLPEENDIRSKGIKYKQIYDDLSAKILDGSYQPGQKLPTENELAGHFNTSRFTVVRAMQDLQQDGFIFRRQGQGTFVHQPHQTENKTFGIMIHEQNPAGPVQMMNSIFSLMVPEISRCAAMFGYSLLLNDVPPEPEADPVKRLQVISQQLADVQVAGVFFTPLELPDELSHVNEAIAETLKKAGVSVVLLDRDIYNTYRRSRYDLVGIHNRHAAVAITEHLIEQGCRKIDFLAESPNCTSAVERIKGYQTALSRADLDRVGSEVHYIASKCLFREGKQDRASAEKILKRVREDGVEAFVCVNDATAADLLNFFLRSGIQIPEEVKITGFDDLPLNDYLAVPLTTIRQPVEALAYEAVRTMIDRIEYPDLPPRDIRVHTDLIARRSSDAAMKEQSLASFVIAR